MVLQEAVMRRRLEKYPGDFSANFNLGALLLGRKETRAAIALLQDAVRAEPEQPVALNTLGAALESDEKLDEALAQFRKALRIEPGFSNARYNMANTLAAQGIVQETPGSMQVHTSTKIRGCPSTTLDDALAAALKSGS